MGGYCTEFFINDVEIGNIVNCNGDCIDVGFGLERLQMMVGEKVVTDKFSILKQTIMKIIESGYSPSNTKQGYVLRKLLTNLIKNNEKIDHLFYENEVKRQIKILNRYNHLKTKHLDKPKEWWFETHGINIDELKT
jgi:alanyl-tRNA synthetase